MPADTMDRCIEASVLFQWWRALLQIKSELLFSEERRRLKVPKCSHDTNKLLRAPTDGTGRRMVTRFVSEMYPFR